MPIRFEVLSVPFPPITDDLDASVPPPPKSGPSQDAVAAIALFTRCTVPVPTPRAFAVLRLPAPVANCSRMRSTTSPLTGRRPSRLPWLRARERPALTRSTIIALELGKDSHHLKHRLSGWRVVRIGFRRCSAEFQFPSPSLKAVTVQIGIVLSSAFV